MKPATMGAPPGNAESRLQPAPEVDQKSNDDGSDSNPFATRRRFLVLACMAGWVGPERVTERILQDVASEVTQ